MYIKQIPLWARAKLSCCCCLPNKGQGTSIDASLQQYGTSISNSNFFHTGCTHYYYLWLLLQLLSTNVQQATTTGNQSGIVTHSGVQDKTNTDSPAPGSCRPAQNQFPGLHKLVCKASVLAIPCPFPFYNVFLQNWQQLHVNQLLLSVNMHCTKLHYTMAGKIYF